MKVVASMNQKGGVGKTTLAVHLAVAAHEAGMRVAILDTDRQQSAVVWSRARNANDPTVAAVTPTKLAAAIEHARKEGFDLVIVDCAPNASTDAVDIVAAVEKVFVPVRPSLFDISAARETIEIIRKSNKDALLVLSACPHRAPEIAMAREALSLSGLPVAKTQIGDRRPYARSIQTGRGVTEVEPDGKTSEEIRALLKEILA